MVMVAAVTLPLLSDIIYVNAGVVATTVAVWVRWRLDDKSDRAARRASSRSSGVNQSS
jgi:hypothetical protein